MKSHGIKWGRVDGMIESDTIVREGSVETYARCFNDLKCCVLVPTYNNEKTLKELLLEIRDWTTNIIVINDGSTDSTSAILNEIEGLKIIEIFPNIGKGNALRKGLRAAREMGFDYAISIDSDGQHFPVDFPAFIDCIKAKPGSLIVGARNMDQGSVPKKSSFGHKFSNFWFWVETGIRLPDTQSGFRLYPLEPIGRMKFITRKYEFEIEVIVRAAWKGVEITSIPIKVFYAPKETRVSHFRPFRDFARTTVLNIVLVFLALGIIRPRLFIRSLNRRTIKEFFRKEILCSSMSDIRITFSVMLGAFFGVAPFWGWQMAIVFGLCVLFRLNKMLALVISNVSIPPMIPIIIWTSFRMGGLVYPDSTVMPETSAGLNVSSVSRDITQYLLGSVLLSICFSLSVGAIAYVLLKIFRRKGKVATLSE